MDLNIIIKINHISKRIQILMDLNIIIKVNHISDEIKEVLMLVLFYRYLFI